MTNFSLGSTLTGLLLKMDQQENCPIHSLTGTAGHGLRVFALASQIRNMIRLWQIRA